jgi:sialic acid synthase SpsE
MNDEPLNFIAEFCQNHLGSKDVLETMIIEAKNSGATHAKIQGLYSEEITKRKEFESKGGTIYRPYKQEFARLKMLDLSFETEKWFVKTCQRETITPMITVFTHKGVERAKNAGFTSIKIASYDCASRPIIRKVLNFANEIVISTGATFWHEIAETVLMLNRYKQSNQKIALLHAKTLYPTQLSEFGILRMLALSMFGYKVGLSDHTKPSETQLIASKIAIFMGASYIERHFTVLNKSETKDGPISINPQELKELKIFTQKTRLEQLNEIGLQNLKLTLPCYSLDPTEQELINRSYYRGRVASKYNGKEFYSWEEINFER